MAGNRENSISHGYNMPVAYMCFKGFKRPLERSLGLCGTINGVEVYLTQFLPEHTSLIIDGAKLAKLHIQDLQMHIDEDFNLDDALKKRWLIKLKNIQRDEPLLLIRFDEGVLIEFKDPKVAIILNHLELLVTE